jgi:quinol monooxygenase YgiN
MSVILTLRMEGDPAKVEEYAAANSELLQGVVEIAKGHGLIAHRFFGSDDGKIMVIDEWPDPDSFQAFFSEAGPQIQEFTSAAGISNVGQPEFWRVLETHDKYGWES